MASHCVRMGIRDRNLNSFLHLLTYRLHVCNPAIFIVSASTTDIRAVRALLYQHTLYRFPAIGFYLFFYINKYSIRCDDAPHRFFLCDSHQGFARRVTNKIEGVFGSPDC